MAARYVLDANVFIEASRRYYAFDLIPAFWQALVDYADKGMLCSIDRIKKELARGNDELAEWARHKFQNWFLSSDETETVEAYRQIVLWVQQQNRFLPAAKADFARCADGWLVAYAVAHSCIVVTHEQYSSDARRSIPIPNICRAFGVQAIDTFAMLRALGVKLG